MFTATTTVIPHASEALASPLQTVPDRPIRVVVADDHPLYRQGIVRALESHGGFSVVGDASNGTEALTVIRELHPDVALIDMRMPELDGIEVIEALARYGPDVPVVLLSAFTGNPLVRSGLAAGAAAYVNKTADRETICLKLEAIARSSKPTAPRDLRTAPDHSVDTRGPRGHRA
ncbi:MAG: response regulator transcription factor [Solirubrobacteraceae bacterium]|nr:response regulator transcription factor [Patulibacter sp.]